MSGNGSRNNSLVPNDLEVTRQFLATNKKVINRGDSFKRRQRPVVDRANVEINIHGSDGENVINDKETENKKIMILQITSSKRKLTNIPRRYTESLSLEAERLVKPLLLTSS